MFQLILLLMAGEVARHGFYVSAVIIVLVALCSMRWLWAVVGTFWLVRTLRKTR